MEKHDRIPAGIPEAPPVDTARCAAERLRQMPLAHARLLPVPAPGTDRKGACVQDHVELYRLPRRRTGVLRPVACEALHEIGLFPRQTRIVDGRHRGEVRADRQPIVTARRPYLLLLGRSGLPGFFPPIASPLLTRNAVTVCACFTVT